MLAYETAPAKAAEFDRMWVEIQHRLAPGAVIRNWGAARGYTGGTFKIEHLDQWSVTVSGGDMQMPRRISKGDFQKLYGVGKSTAPEIFPVRR
jgi:hypothetical protein